MYIVHNNNNNNNYKCFYDKYVIELLKKYYTFNDIMGSGILIVIVAGAILCNS